MHVNLPLNKVEPTQAKPAAANTGKPQPGNFSELLKNAQAAPAPAAPAAPATPF